MKSIHFIMLLAWLTYLPQAAASVACADVLPATQPLEEKHECLELSAKQAELAKKMLTQRLTALLDKIERTADSVPATENMANVAVRAKATLKKITKLASDGADAQKEATDLTLRLKGSRDQADVKDLVGKARALATEAIALATCSEEADKHLVSLTAALSMEQQYEAQSGLLVAIKLAGETAEKAKSDAAGKQKELVAMATKIHNAKTDSVVQMQTELDAKMKLAYDSNREVLALGNAVMYDMMGPFDHPVQQTPPHNAREKEKRLSFLMFLESHPLLNSEVSGSGVQLTSTAGEGKVTIKQAVQWGRTSNQQMSLALSAPINKGAESELSTAKNNVLLDKLAGDTTVKLDYTRLAPFGSANAQGISAFWLWGGSAELGYQEFSYLDPTRSFADPAKPVKVEEHNGSYALAAYAGYSPFDSKTLFLLRYARQYEREGQKTVSICPPLAAGKTYVTCQSGSLGAPEGKKFNIMSIEARHTFNNFAVSGTFSYDRTSKVRAIAVPLYFSLFNRGYGAFGAGEPQFSAGLIYGWRSDTKSSVGIFAGVPFSMAKPD